MKKIILATALFASTFVFSQEGIVFQDDMSFADVLAKAKKENRLVFVDAFASWCGPCKLMAKNVFPQKEISEYFNANFVNARIDMEKGEGPSIAQKYGVRSYPTFLFLNGDGEVVSQSLGYKEAPDFLSDARLANNPNNKKGSMKDRFSQGEKDPDFLMNIIKTNATSDYDFAKNASERYFANRKSGAFTKEEASAILYFIKSSNDPNYSVFKNSKKELLPYISEKTYNDLDTQYKLSGIADKATNPAAQTIDDTFFLNEARRLVSQDEAFRALNRLKINYYMSVKNLPAFRAAAMDYYKNPEDADTNELNQVSAVFAGTADKPEELKKALEWAQKSVMRGESEQNTLILAMIYLKLNDFQHAKSFAELSGQLSAKAGHGNPAADEILQNIKTRSKDVK